MEASLLSDYEFACQLHAELNGYEMAPLQSMLPQPVVSNRERSRSPINNNNSTKPQVSIENQQAITIQKERKSRSDYFMPLMNTYIDMTRTQEWKAVNMESNLQQMFNNLQKQFFSKWLKNSKYIIKWDKTGIISDDCCFKIFGNEILVKSSGMVQPRINLISILMHILIHFYLFTASKGAIKINSHDDNFRQIMLFLNDTMKTKISTFHKFLFSPEEAEYPKQWYQCTGICTSYEPFHGTVRCTSIPDESHIFFADHEEACGGQFFRIFEMSRKNPETNETEKAYVRNTNYMFPKPRAAGKNLKSAATQVREICDLTDDTAETATVQNLCDVINLDDTDWNVEETGSPSNSLVADFTCQSDTAFEKCPFCTKIFLSAIQLPDHFDKCRGFQQKVIFRLKK